MRHDLALVLIAAETAALGSLAINGMTSRPTAALVGFNAESELATQRMTKGMTAKSSGNPDRDFAVTMISHHEGAIDMALAELRFGRNQRLLRIAQGIVVEQRQEIEAMRAILTEELASSSAGPVSAEVCRTPTLSTELE